MKGGRSSDLGLTCSASISRRYTLGSSVSTSTSPIFIRPREQVTDVSGSYPRKVYRPHFSSACADSSMKQCEDTFLSILIASMGVMKSESISQLSGTVLYLPSAASSSTSFNVGLIFMVALPRVRIVRSDIKKHPGQNCLLCQGRMMHSRCHLDSRLCRALCGIPTYPRQVTPASRRRILCGHTRI